MLCNSCVFSVFLGDEEFDETEFEAAKSSLIFEVIEEEKTVSDAADQSILYYFRGLPYTHRYPGQWPSKSFISVHSRFMFMQTAHFRSHELS